MSREQLESRIMRSNLFAAVCFTTLLSSPPLPAQDARKDTNPPAVFTDPERKAKLTKAFPEIDKQVAA